MTSMKSPPLNDPAPMGRHATPLFLSPTPFIRYAYISSRAHYVIRTATRFRPSQYYSVVTLTLTCSITIASIYLDCLHLSCLHPPPNISA